MNKRDEQIENEHKRVLNAIEQHIRDTHTLCSIKDIHEMTGIGYDRCKTLVHHLLGNQLVKVYHHKRATLVVPKNMWNHVLRMQGKPDWLSDSAFKEEVTIMNKIRSQNEMLNKFEKFKTLLYGTSTPLEEAVAFSLDFLGFENVKHLGGADEHDVEFTSGNTKYILEVSGSFEFIRKDKPKDLNEWIEKEALKEENKDRNLKGLLAVNPYRNDKPDQRKDILSKAAKKLIKKVYRFNVLTTVTLFNLVRDMHYNKISQKEARKKVLSGDVV